VSHSSPNPFGDQVSLKLGDGSHNVEKELAGRRSRVDSLGVADEVDPQRTEFVQAFDQGESEQSGRTSRPAPRQTASSLFVRHRKGPRARFRVKSSAVKPELEFLTKTIYDPAVFWVMITAVATIFLVILAAVPLRDLAKTRRTDLVRHLRADFWTLRMRAIMFLIDHNLIEYQEDAIPFFSFARPSDNPARVWLSQIWGDTVVLSTFEIDDELLNPLEEVAILAFAKSISFKDVSALFGNFMRSTSENEEIRRDVQDVRRRQESANAWMNLERIVPILSRLDERLLKRSSRQRWQR